jgi:hypothetical protein
MLVSDSESANPTQHPAPRGRNRVRDSKRNTVRNNSKGDVVVKADVIVGGVVATHDLVVMSGDVVPGFGDR